MSNSMVMTMLIKPEMTDKRISEVKTLIAENPALSRTQLSKLVCQIWDWRSPNGQPKDIAARDMLRDLEKKGLINLPLSQTVPNFSDHRYQVLHLDHDTTPMGCSLEDLLPLKIHLPEGEEDLAAFKSYLDQFHYLGFGRTVGENMKYMVYSRNGSVVACLLFGSAAWSCRDRDKHIGWNKARRKEALHLLTNNTRFWIPQWVRTPNLASHVLSRVMRRLCADWESRYGHHLLAVETFVDSSRFLGSCYKAANWIYVGRTSGRGRDGGHHNMIVPRKDIYLYPLDRHYAEKLRGEFYGKDQF